jgi:carbon-monoxide dehydrogenase large subunit
VSAIGRPLGRIEDGPLLRGQGCFAADFDHPDQIFMRIVRSPIAFGRLIGVDTQAAGSLDGVTTVWTANDIADIPQIDFRMTRIEGLGAYRQWVLARDYVRYVGEPVAAIFARNAYIAEDAAELVVCKIDEQPPMLDVITEPAAFMPETQPGLLSEPAVVRKEYGDIDAAFARAHRIVELQVKVGRHSGVPLETRGALAVYDEGRDLVTMYGAAKVPHYNRDAIAKMMGIPRARLNLSEGHVGGGFGVRGELYPEDVLVCVAALRLKRSVKWIEDRKEHLIAANHSRDQVHRLKAAVDERGFILGLDAAFFTDQGAYVRTHGATVTDLAAGLLPGPYVIPAYRVEGHIRLTNKTPAGTYRAPGRYETTFARERLMDRIAHELRLSPIDVRRVNLVAAEAMPFKRDLEVLGTPVVYDSGDYHGLLERLLEHVAYGGLQKELADRRAAGEAVGAGLGYFVEKSGLGPNDLVRVSVEPDGSIEIVTGVASLGQGIETAMAQICSETLSLPIQRIRVVHGQTDRIEYGAGAFASRVTVMTGSAVQIAAEKLREQALDAAIELLQTDRRDLSIADGVVIDSGGGSVSLGAIAAHLAPQGGLKSEGEFRASHMTYPYGIHFAQVEIDRETAGIHITRYVVAYDVGRAINPMLVDGQIVGGAVQGIGGALLEEFLYDQSGQPLAASLADYLLPTSREVPHIETLIREDAPSPINPLGAKGAGEGGITAAGAALAAAIDDALMMPGAVDRLPMSPQRLHAIISTAGARRSAIEAA